MTLDWCVRCIWCYFMTLSLNYNLQSSLQVFNPFGYGGNTLTSAAKWISINSEFLHNHTSSQNAESGLIQSTKHNPQHYKNKIKKSAAKKNTQPSEPATNCSSTISVVWLSILFMSPSPRTYEIFELKYIFIEAFSGGA